MPLLTLEYTTDKGKAKTRRVRVTSSGGHIVVVSADGTIRRVSPDSKVVISTFKTGTRKFYGHWLSSDPDDLARVAVAPELLGRGAEGDPVEEELTGQQAAAELLAETDTALEATARHADRIDALLEQIRAVRAETRV